jgi:hypothetical protein
MREPLRPTELRPAQTNPQARNAHRREVWWQVVLPLLLDMLLGAAAIFGLVTGRVGSVQNAAQLATIFLTIPLMLVGVLFFILTIFLIFALGRIMHWIPLQTNKAQQLADKASQQAIRSANLLAGPLLFVDSWANAIGSIFRRRR